LTSDSPSRTLSTMFAARRLVVLMTALLGVGLSCAHGTATSPPHTWKLSPELSVRELTSGILVVTHEKPFPANSVVVDAADGTLVLVGSPYTADATRTVLAWLHERFGERKRVAIDTHFHDDAGVGGNPAFRAAGIPIYGSDLTARLLAEHDPKATLPDRVFPMERGLDLDFGEPVRVSFPGPGHTRDNVVVYFPKRRMLVGGCLVKAGDSIGNTADADLAGWESSVASLASYDVDWIVPGHDDRFDRGLVAHSVDVVGRASKR
jgi:metallo-beta-lactamase class B